MRATRGTPSDGAPQSGASQGRRPSEPGLIGPSDYVEGERVFGPPLGTYDADWVAAAAVEQDPELAPDDARRRAARAWELLRAGDDPEPEVGPVVARVARDWCRAYGL